MKKILIVVDMQNDFVDGSLGSANAKGIVPNIIKKIEESEKGNVFATMDTHFGDYLDTHEGKNLQISHCINGTEGHKIQADIEKALAKKEATIIAKSTFGSYELIQQLIRIYMKEPVAFEIAGLCTDVCVITNALLLRAALPEAEIIVDASACAGITEKSHEAALLTMKSCHIDIQNFDF